jgi:hypothetical protein
MDSGTVNTKQEAGNEAADHSPNAHRQPPQGRSMKCRTLGRTGIEGGDVSLEDERPTGL